MIKEGFNDLWSTPVYLTNATIPDIITQHILTNYGDSNKISANVSGDNILDDPKLGELKRFIVSSFENYLSRYDINLKNKDYDLRAWITGYGTNYAMPKHNHSGSHLSAVFYLLCEEKNGGNIVLHDPRTNANRGYVDDFQSMFDKVRFTPSSGDVLIFPSFLYHNVETFNGKMRLAMPVDLTIHK